ncbi:uncharacterized protein LOC130976628 [Arachis stenosperma]|uniref:uncharacterized protein LOC130976628 n=1 Tax=Arachis stenosperma TaxID=217475 RepID=UPI0025AB650C|nr:uncharacterized protein LOC130976628 [Arachis stenosperma]
MPKVRTRARQALAAAAAASIDPRSDDSARRNNLLLSRLTSSSSLSISSANHLSLSLRTPSSTTAMAAAAAVLRWVRGEGELWRQAEFLLHDGDFGGNGGRREFTKVDEGALENQPPPPPFTNTCDVPAAITKKALASFSQVSTIHKANVMQKSKGLFLKDSREVAEEYAEIKYEKVIIDNDYMMVYL